MALSMAFFGGDSMSEKLSSAVTIESPTINSRQITASIIIDGSVESIWNLLTDYDNLT